MNRQNRKEQQPKHIYLYCYFIPHWNLS